MWGYREAALFWAGVIVGGLTTAIVFAFGWFLWWAIF